MNEKNIEIALHLLLPGKTNCGECVDKLISILHSHSGILQAHLHKDHQPVDLCIHYDPDLVTLGSVKRIVHTTGAEISHSAIHEEIIFSGLTSSSSAELLEKELVNLNGMLHVSLNYPAGIIKVAFDNRQLTLEEVNRTIKKYGAKPIRKNAVKGARHTHTAIFRRSILTEIKEHWPLVLVGFGGLILLAGFLGEKLRIFPANYSTILFLLSYAASGFDPARQALSALMRGKFDTDILMLAAAIGAGFLGHWAEGSFLLFLFGIGHAGEHYAFNKARNAINALGSYMPKTALVKKDDQLVELPVEEIAIGNLVIVRPGDQIPVDGQVNQGSSSVDQSPITGESVPVEKNHNDEVYAGSINREASLEIRVTQLSQDTMLSRVIRLVTEAQAQKSPTERFANRFTTFFVPVVLILVVLVAVVPPMAGWIPFSESFYRAMLLLVAASPCALAIGTPAAVLSGLARAAHHGVLIKGGAHLENLGRLKVIAFDKTGTLTEGCFEVTDVIPLNDTEPEELLRLAAAVEKQSNHPLAHAIVKAAEERDLILPYLDHLEIIPGQGVRGHIEGKLIWIGSRKLYDENDGLILDNKLREVIIKLENAGKTTMIVRYDGAFLGVLALSDVLRPSVNRTIDQLKHLGIKQLVMLTGDNPKAAGLVGQEAGMTQVKASLLPEHKLKAILDLKRGYGAVAMVGDGINDAPALAAATVGIAMGGAGTAAALETADVALMADDLGKLPLTIGLSRASRAIIQQNLMLSLGVIILLIITSIFGLVQLGWAVILHEGSTVLVALNSLRLLRYKLPELNGQPYSTKFSK